MNDLDLVTPEQSLVLEGIVRATRATVEAERIARRLGTFGSALVADHLASALSCLSSAGDLMAREVNSPVDHKYVPTDSLGRPTSTCNFLFIDRAGPRAGENYFCGKPMEMHS